MSPALSLNPFTPEASSLYMALTTDREKTAHILRRFGLGASEAEVDYYSKDGLNSAIDLLLSDDPDDGFSMDLQSLANVKGLVAVPVMTDWWITRMLVTRKPLHEKMTLFWHDHFATSGSKVNQSQIMYGQNQVLRKNCIGDFPTLLMEVSKDPAMIIWLDNQENQKGHANENFAREVMELFTLGIGHYSEKDVQEAARAFTGWTIKRLSRKPGRPPTAEFVFRPLVHDTGTKTVLGTTGSLTGEDVLKILTSQPRCAEFLTQKIWNWFVWPDPDAATIAPFANRFRDSGLNIKSLLADIMKSKEFYSPRAERTVVKNPVDFCVSTMRQLGVGEGLAKRIVGLDADSVPRAILAPSHVAQISMKGMGMWLLYPPDVAGWDIGNSWITSATMVERMSWAEKIFGGKGGRLSMRYPAYALLQQDPTPKGVVGKLLSVFDATVKPDKVQAIVGAAEKQMQGSLTPANANELAAFVTRLIFATPEFQFA